MRQALKSILERNGFRVVGEATNGIEAILLTKDLSPDIITMDITMPKIDGITAVKEILKLNPNAKICMVSAMGQGVMVMDSILAGAKNFLVKPYREEKVIRTLRSILEERGTPFKGMMG
jgi:two-component system chemotaxis response regulator CheY